MDQFSVLDLFSGMGGLSRGFFNEGFKVTGVDSSQRIGQVFKKYVADDFRCMNLSEEMVEEKFDIIIGGPPCKPWSPVNRTLDKHMHRDYILVEKFVKHVRRLKPRMFIMENVPALRSDSGFKEQVNHLSHSGYGVETFFVRYSDFGAATSRKRLIMVGVLKGSASNFKDGLDEYKKEPKTLRAAIGKYKNRSEGDPRDHIWPHLKTIGKYREKYETGKFGWRILDWELPAPSFGNVMKTYILHPDSEPSSPDARVISVLEVSRIMGFGDDFEFPEGLHMGEKYQMLVNSVSPIFSTVLAKRTRKFLENDL